MRYKVTIVILVILITFASIFLAFAEPPEQKTVEGQGYYYITGESYPTTIAITGYNSRDKIMYVNVELETTKSIPVNNVADFYYLIEVYDPMSILMGSVGSHDIPMKKSAVIGEKTVQIPNHVINLSMPLPAQNRIVVTVTEVDIRLGV